VDGHGNSLWTDDSPERGPGRSEVELDQFSAPAGTHHDRLPGKLATAHEIERSALRVLRVIVKMLNNYTRTLEK